MPAWFRGPHYQLRFMALCILDDVKYWSQQRRYKLHEEEVAIEHLENVIEYRVHMGYMAQELLRAVAIVQWLGYTDRTRIEKFWESSFPRKPEPKVKPAAKPKFAADLFDFAGIKDPWT